MSYQLGGGALDAANEARPGPPTRGSSASSTRTDVTVDGGGVAVDDPGSDIVAGGGAYRAIVRVFTVTAVAVVALCLALAPEGSTQWRWSDGSYFSSEVNAIAGAAVSTSYVLRCDLYGGTLSGFASSRAADGKVTTRGDGFLVTAGDFWDMYAQAGCLSSFVGSPASPSGVCRGLSALLGMAVFIRIALTCAALSAAVALVGLGETLLLCAWLGAEAAPAAAAHSQRLWRWLAPGAAACFVCLVAWPITVSAALQYVRDEFLGGTIAANTLLVRPGGAYFWAVAATALLLWATRESRRLGGAHSSRTAVRVAAAWQAAVGTHEAATMKTTRAQPAVQRKTAPDLSVADTVQEQQQQRRRPAASTAAGRHSELMQPTLAGDSTRGTAGVLPDSNLNESLPPTR